MKLVREFTCGISGDECVIILNHFNEEICLLKSEFQEIQSNIDHDERELWLETH
jgi:hypothetical protein